MGSRPVKGGRHPDGVQCWSRPTSVPTCDVEIEDNLFSGALQGIGCFNHGDDGGYDRMAIRRNRVIGARAHGIAVYAARGLVLEDNRISTAEGSTIWARLTVNGCQDVVRRGNTVEAWGRHLARAD
jgi:hypothetical protein